MKSILLYVSDDSSMEARLQAALDLGRHFGAHLTCLQAAPIRELVTGDLYAGVYFTTELVETFRQREEEQRIGLESRLKDEGACWNWVTATADPAFSLIEQAGLADLVVLGLPQDGNAARARSLVSDVAVTVRAPVLAVPDTQSRLECDGPAIVAWNGSLEAAHALRSALQLLAKAASVRIATVADQEFRRPPTDAAEYLSRHGITSEICDWQRGTRRISDVLLEGARALGGAYLVAGAYGHTRFREAILGGVTRELIEAASIPLLITH